MVCPYSLDVPGGVQSHVRDLAETLIGLDHEVSVLAPTEGVDVPAYVVPVGRAVAVPYNGSVARMAFGPVAAARTRRWLQEGRFDVLHVHEPATPSLSLLALWLTDPTGCPVVATYHSAHARSRALAAGAAILRPSLERISARIAVSESARGTQVVHVGGEPVVIPNGVHVDRFANARVRPEWRGESGTLAFVGRLGDPRKGFAPLAEAFGHVAAGRPGVRLLVAGAGVTRARELVPTAARDQVSFLGPVGEADLGSVLRTCDVYVAPHTGAESFGVVLAEAMAAGAPVLASDLPAFRRLLGDGALGALVRAGDVTDLATGMRTLLDDPVRRSELSAAAGPAVRRYDWPGVAQRILRVYETVVDGGR